MSVSLVVAAAAATAVALPPSRAAADFPAAALAKACKGKEGWADPAPPAHLFGNTWYVGTCGISALLVTTPRGHVLVDAGVPEAAPLVAASIAKLGVRLQDVRWIVGSHEHFDHAGAIPELKRTTGASLAATRAYARVLATGRPDPDDPQQDLLLKHPMQPVRTDRTVRSGGTIAIGGVVLTAVETPAHSPGSTSWTWRSCQSRVCHTITYADSTTTISSATYRFLDHPARIAAVRVGLARIADLPCGILVTPHPSASALFERMEQGLSPDPAGCRSYADAARGRFEARLAKEGAEPAKAPR